MKRYIFIIAALTALIFSGCSNDDDRPVKTPIDPLTDIYGVVTDNQGNRLQGIVVSDGYTCTATDENGVYQLTARGILLSCVPFDPRGIRGTRVRRAALLLAETDRRGASATTSR